MSPTPDRRESSSQQLDGRIVAQIQVVAAVVGREQVDDHQHAGRFLLDRNATPLDQVGQDRLGQRDAILHHHLGHVQVGARLERTVSGNCRR